MAEAQAQVAEDVLAILICPACGSPVVQTPAGICCKNSDCCRLYPFRDGVPVMLVEEATVLSESDWQAAHNGHSED